MEGVFLIVLALRLSLAPQVVVNSASVSGVALGAAPAAAAVTQTDCSTLCPMIWGLPAVAEDEPYEVAADAEQIQVGKACRCLSGPGPKKRLDGSE